GQITDTVNNSTTGCDTIRTINVRTMPLLTATVDTAVCTNQFPVTIFGHLFNEAGQIVDTVSNSTAGCDTMSTINVTTLPLLTAIVDTAVCNNQLPLTIFGHLFTQAGSVVDTVASTAGGCDTIRTINVTTLPLLTAIVDTAVCNNQLPFTIFGHVFNAAGTITDTVASTTGGCDTIRTITVTTLPLLAAIVDTAVCNNQLPFNIFGHLFTQAGSVVDTIAGWKSGGEGKSVIVVYARLIRTARSDLGVWIDCIRAAV